MNHKELPAHVRAEFEAIVGARYVTADPAMMSGHAWWAPIGKVTAEEKMAPDMPIAVVLPGTTEQVAAVVKCCLRHGLLFRAHSTGYGSSAQVKSPDSISIDLRRMNTLQIDAHNRMAVIGPYVTAGVLQAEALKHGMTCHIIGAGPAHSPLASATSLCGVGATSQGTSMNVRNLLAFEWVTPQGEIVRGGSAGADGGWFAGEGPGPGVRGMVRGMFGAQGGLGVFTKIGIKLYPVPVKGPLPVSGRRPQLGLPLPENVSLLQVVWPDWERQRDASFELIDENLCFAMLRMPPDHIGWTVTRTNAEYVDQVARRRLSPAARQDALANWTLLVMSRSPAEHAWRMGVIQDILARTGGRVLDLPTEEVELLHRNLFTSIYIPRVLRAAGLGTSFGVMDSLHHWPNVMRSGEEVLEGLNGEDGPLVPGGKEEMWAWPHEGRYFWAENILQFDPADRKAREAAAQGLLGHYPVVWKNHAGVDICTLVALMELHPREVGQPQNYIREVKHYYDPNDASRTGEYVPLKVPSLLQAVMPALKPLLTSKPFIKLVSKGIAKNGM